MHNSSTFNPLNLPPNLDQENRFEFCLSFPSLLISKYKLFLFSKAGALALALMYTRQQTLCWVMTPPSLML